MICKKCGQQIPDGETICPICGEDLSPEELPEDTEIEEISVEPEIEEADYSEEINHEAEDGDYDVEESFAGEIEEATGEYTATEKKSPFSKIITGAVVIVILALALFAGYNEIFGVSSETAPFVYLKEGSDGNDVCVSYYDGKEIVLVKNFESGLVFKKNNDFVTAGKNIFYLDNGSLKAYTMGSDEPVLISKDALAGSVVVAKDTKNILFTKKKDDKNILCSYKTGGKPEEIATLKKVKYDTIGTPCYGFLKGTSKPWYIALDENSDNGKLYVDEKNIEKNVNEILHISAKGDTFVYITGKNENEKLMIFENGKSSELSDNALNPVYYVTTPAKGVIYLSDIKEPSEENAAQGSAGTLYFKEFGKDKKTIDTDVSVYTKVSSMMTTSQNSATYFDGADDAENDMMLYIRNNEILMAKGGTNLALPADFDYQSANPLFSEDGNRIIYTDTNEKLVYCDLTNNKWSDPVEIAKKGNAVMTNDDASLIAFIETTGEGQEAENKLSLYNAAKKSVSKLTDNTVSSPFFAKDNKSVYYTDKLDMEKGTAALNISVAGEKGIVIDKAISGFASGSTKDAIAFKLADDSGSKLDIYTVKDNKLVEVVKNMVNVFDY